MLASFVIVTVLLADAMGSVWLGTWHSKGNIPVSGVIPETLDVRPNKSDIHERQHNRLIWLWIGFGACCLFQGALLWGVPTDSTGKEEKGKDAMIVRHDWAMYRQLLIFATLLFVAFRFRAFESFFLHSQIQTNSNLIPVSRFPNTGQYISASSACGKASPRPPFCSH